MHKRRIISTVLSWTITCGAGIATVRADGLAGKLTNLFGPAGVTLTDQPVPWVLGDPPPIVAHTAHFTSDSLATLGILVKQLAPSAADFPAISTVPGFTFRYNPALQTFERSSESLGPVFVERPQTIGRGKLDLGLSYLFVNFEELEGEELDGLAFRGLQHNDCCAAPPSGNFPGFERDTADLFFDEFDLESHVMSVFATYGITDRWDVSVLLPVIVTDLEVRARARVNNESGANVHSFEPIIGAADRATERLASVDDSATGVGDLLLRTKYHILDLSSFDLASGLTIRVPTGEEDDFQGIEGTAVTPFFSVSQVYGPFDLHLSSGVEINTDDLDRTRVRYGAGMTYQLGESFALLADVVGSSGITEEDLSVEIPTFVAASNRVGSQTVTQELRTDIVDLAVGFKASLASSAVGFINFFVPLNDDGLRAEVIPSAGLEVSF